MINIALPGHGDRESTAVGLPRIVCLCGSTKHMSVFDQANRDETLSGRIVLTVGVDLKDRHKDVLSGKTDAEALVIKDRLDCLHRRKIDLADEILVLNVDGPPGESTRREIEYARQRGKPVRYLNPPASTET